LLSGFLEYKEQERQREDPFESTSVIQAVNSLLETAVLREASDIHLDPWERGLKARLRIDGLLRETKSFSSEMAPLIISRLKIMAGMDIAERRLPQDGNLQFQVNNKRINVRLSTLPTVYGEKLVLRLLNPEKIILPLENLGFNEENYRRYLEFLSSNHGMVLISGPTGCGKTTTLYSTLHAINSPEKNIITVEDPVEFRLDGINQVQVNNKIELTFARTLRSILRQDPNVIMVGEIRDKETAEIATRAALTGHLVFSTLHTNDAPGAVTRLLDMGVERFMLTSSLVGVVAQRLIRLNCRNCLETYFPEKEKLTFLEKLGDIKKEEAAFARGRGCEKCDFTGFKGRTAIHEVMPVDPSLRRLIMGSEDTEKIRQYALSQGMQTLLQDGLNRAADGQTTVEEVIRVAYSVF